MKAVFKHLIFVTLFLLGSRVKRSLTCPPKCSCEKRDNTFKINCDNRGMTKPVNVDDLPDNNTLLLDLSNNEIESIGDFAFKGKKAARIKKLILSGNRLKVISPTAFTGLSKLTKLDLSQNRLTSLPADVFKKLKNLKILDLSENNILMLNGTQFIGLKNLRIINLSSNKLSFLPDGLFYSLRNLQKIELQLNRLICDCSLKWMINWMSKMKSKGKTVSVQGKCDHPYAVKDKKVNDLKKNQMVCGSDLDLPVRSFGPKGDQIAFNGDSYTFECNSTWLPGTEMAWYKGNELVHDDPSNKHRNVLFKFDANKLAVYSVLDIKQLTAADNGYYSCHITHKGGYQHISTSQLLIIPSNVQHCPAVVTETDRGTFYWHHTAAGGAAFLPCPVGVRSSLLDHSGTESMARRNCSLQGVWREVEAQVCAHSNEITRALHDLKEEVVKDATVASVSEQLLNISKRAKNFNDPLDVVYAAEVVDHLVQVIGRDQILNSDLVSTVSNIMEADSALLVEAQRRSKACSSMVILLDLFSTRFPMDILPDLTFVTNNIAVYVERISPNNVTGKMCYVTVDSKSRLNDIDCLPCRYNSSCGRQMLLQSVDTSIYLPPSLFQSLPWDVNVKFQFIVYSNSKLFPEVTNESEKKRSVQVFSSVVSAQFGGIPLDILSHPVIFKFRKHQGKQLFPVYWEHDENGGLGRWKKNADCGEISFHGNNTIAKCSQLSDKNFFAVMMLFDRSACEQAGKAKCTSTMEQPSFANKNVSKPGGSGPTNARSDDNTWLDGSLELVVFVGAGICSLLILITLIMYAFIRELRYDRDDAAMLMNHCIALLVTIVVFVTGINHVSNPLLCRSIGVLLHYFSLSSLLWIGCTGVCLHRLIRTSIEPEEYNPVLRYYMVSWGIPLIICGITIAGNVENYKIEDYCWLNPNPFYGAFVGPACLIILIDLIIYLRLSNLIKELYDNKDVTPQAGSEAEAETETAAEENALVIESAPQPGAENSGEGVSDKSTLPNKDEMMDLLRGNCIILLVIAMTMALGIMVIRHKQPLALYIVLSCIFAVALIILGVLIFIYHCYRKTVVRLLWKKYCCRCRCIPDKKYRIQEDCAPVEGVEEAPVYETITSTANGEAGQFSGEEIHGAKKLGDGDSVSNVSLPSSAAITLNKNALVVALPDKDVEVQTDKASSVSDKQSWASAPLPHGFKPRGKLLKKPPGYRHSYTEYTRETPTIEECRRAPLAPPEGTASSIDSSAQLPTDTASYIAPSEGLSSVREAIETLNATRNSNASCSASEVSIPIDIPPIKKRPPVPGSSSQGSEGPPQVQFKNSRPPMPNVTDTTPVSTPTPTAQDLFSHYSIAEGTASNIPRNIPRDHVVVREKYHIPYEPRAMSEKPRDHYQILPLPTNRRDHYLLQPGNEQYQGQRGQHLGPNPHNQYQAAPEHYPIPGDHHPAVAQRTYDLNQVPSPTQGRPYEYYHMPRDTTHSLYQMARDRAANRPYENYQVPYEQRTGQGTTERYQEQHEHNPVHRSHEQAPKPADFSHISIDPGFSNKSPDHINMSHEPNIGPKSPNHGHVSHDSSFGQRSHDGYQILRDHMPRDQYPPERTYENIPIPSEQSSVQNAHEHNTSHDSELPRDAARDHSVTSDNVHDSGVERSHDQYAGEGPREQPQALNPGEDNTAVDKITGLPLDKNGARAPNTSRGTREQPNGVHVSRRRRRNPYQIAREIHHNLGIETRKVDGQSRRANRAAGETRSQSQKNANRALLVNPGETPKERTPRSSMSSWKDERSKPKQKEWGAEQPSSAVFVPVPYLKRTTPEPQRNETSV